MAPMVTFPNLSAVSLLAACSFASDFLSKTATIDGLNPPLANLLVEAMLAAWADGHLNGRNESAPVGGGRP